MRPPSIDPEFPIFFLVIRVNRSQLEAQQEEFGEVLLAMGESILNFLQIHRELIRGHALITVQNMLGKRSNPLDPVDVVFGSAIRETLTVSGRVLFAIASQRLGTAERIRAIDKAFAGGGLNVDYERVDRYVPDHLRIAPPIPLQQPHHDTVTSHSPTTASLSPSTAMVFVQFDPHGGLLARPSNSAMQNTAAHNF